MRHDKPRRIILHTGGQTEVWDDPARFKSVAAGRRWGKTELALAKLLTSCLGTNGVYRYVAPTAVLARKTLWRRKLKRVLDPSWLSRPPNETNMEVFFKSGALLEIIGADNPDSLRGEGVSGVVLDEYADMKPEAWSEAVRPSLADMRGWALFIGTPKSFNHFYEVYERGHSDQHPKWASWSFKSLDNPLLDPDEVDEARRTTDPRTFRQEWEASFEALKGRAYYAFSRSTHVRTVELNRALPACVMFDFNINPATATIGQYQGGEVRAWREVWITDAGGEATKASATAALQLLKDVNWQGAIRVYGDATGKAGKTTGPSDHQVLREVFAGATWCIPKAQPHVKDRVSAVNARFQTMDGHYHAVIDPSCKHLIADCEQVVFLDNGELDQKSNPMLTHSSSGWGYFVHQEFPPVPKKQAVASITADTRWQKDRW